MIEESLVYYSNIEILDLDLHPIDLCVLPDNKILITNSYDNNIVIYDEYFDFVKKVDKIDGKSFYPYGITTNNENRIYISDQSTHSIIMTDLELNKLKIFGNFGDSETELNIPLGICYSNCYLYICDHDNKRIQVLSHDLEFCKSLPLEYSPLTIEVIENTACVKTSNLGIEFYDLKNNFTLKVRYNRDCNSRVSIIGENFYEVASFKNSLCVYNQDGSLIKEIEITSTQPYIKSSIWDAKIAYFNNYIIISCYHTRKLLKFKLKDKI